MKTTYIFIVFVLVSFTLPAQSSTKNFIDQNYIEVLGTAEKEVIPNMIYLQITLSEKDKKGRKSVEEQETEMIIALKKIDESIAKKLSIIRFSSTYIRYFFKKNNVEKVKQYELLLTDTLLLAPIFLALDNLDVSNVNIVKLDHSNMDEYRQQTKVAAIVAARKKGKLYTKAIDQTIGRALYIKEVNSSVSQIDIKEANTVLKNRNSYSSKVVASGYTPIQLKKIFIYAQVLTKFELK